MILTAVSGSEPRAILHIFEGGKKMLLTVGIVVVLDWQIWQNDINNEFKSYFKITFKCRQIETMKMNSKQWLRHWIKCPGFIFKSSWYIDNILPHPSVDLRLATLWDCFTMFPIHKKMCIWAKSEWNQWVFPLTVMHHCITSKQTGIWLYWFHVRCLSIFK